MCPHVAPPCVCQASSMVAVGLALAAAGFAGKSPLCLELIVRFLSFLNAINKKI